MAHNFTFKTQPDPHQLEILQRTATLSFHAIHWEQGLGKSKIIVDNITFLYTHPDPTLSINGALIVAPNGIDINWEIDEIPKHLPEHLWSTTRLFRFSTKRKGSKSHKEQVKFLREHHGLAIMLMSYDAFMTMEGKEAALLFLEQREAFYVLDESSRIKTPGAKRTQRIVRTAYRAKYRRTLTGTPMPNGAFDIYKQMEFLDPPFWDNHNLTSLTEFKNYFGVFDSPRTFRSNAGQTYEFEKLIGFQRLEELNKMLAPISSRLLKKDVLQLPPKIYQPRYFELSKEQRTLYEQLKNEYLIWLDKETLVTANLAIVRLLRLQQISCGYLPTENDSEPTHIIPGENTRLNLLEELIEDHADKTIIWARYRLDIDLITTLLKSKNRSFVVYDGRTTEEDLIDAKHRFQNTDTAQFFVSNPAKGAEGITLHAAKNVIYYSNSFNLLHRLQSEDRAHRRGLEHPVNYIDLLGNDTIDKQIMLNLCGKMNTSDVILGDTPGTDIRSNILQWLTE